MNTTAQAEPQLETKTKTTIESKPEIHQWQTKGGTKVLFIASHEVPIVDVQISFAAGSAYDDSQYGLASLTASLLETGIKGMDENELINQVTSLGANISENTARDRATFSLRSMSMPQYLDPSVSLFSRIITEPTFPTSQFDRIKKLQLTSIQMDDQYPDEIAYKAFIQELYQGHPYGHAIDGNANSVQALTVDAAKAFYQKYYTQKNASIAIIGDLTIEQAQAITDSLIDKLPIGEKASAIQKPQEIKKSKSIHIEFPSNQTTIIQGTLGIAKGNPDFFALSVANQILGGDGMSSLLFKRVRKEHGLAYGVHSGIRTLKEKGFFLIEAKTRNDKSAESLSIIDQTFDELYHNGPSEEQLLMAKKYLVGSFPLSMATNRSKLGLLSTIGFYDLPLNYIDTYIDHIDELNQKDVKDTLQTIINPEHMITVTVGQKQSSN
ncbi:insulinase family protein [Thiotrichales bacterium 19S11-10]|nr:insulinase family protein [Thiotrichales bacterium 19S11-10]